MHTKDKVPDRLLPDTGLIGTYDTEGEKMGLKDKFEIVIVRNWLWSNHEMSLKPTRSHYQA